MALRKLLIGLFWVLSLQLTVASTTVAQSEAPTDLGADAEATAYLNKMADFLAKSEQFSVTLRIGYDVLQESGEKIEFGEVRRLVLRRPDRLRADIEHSDGEKGLVIFDGKDITVYNEKDKVFASASRPGDLDGAVTYLVSELKLRLPLAMMFLSRLPSELERRVRAVEIVERSTILEVPCVHLAARTDDVDFQVWIPSAGQPLPRRVVITYKHEDGQPQFWADFSDWNLTPNPSESLFAFTPPEGVHQIPFLAQMETAKHSVEKEKKGDKK
jgi:hypothetical protein